MGELFDNLCQGPVVIVDDKIKEPTSGDSIHQIKAKISDKNLPILEYVKIVDAIKNIKSFQSTSFIILDWRMGEAKAKKPTDVSLGDEAEESYERAVIHFIKELQKHTIAPIFILSNSPEAEILPELESAGLQNIINSCLFIDHKSNLLANDALVNKIEEWIKHSPHVYLGKWWTNECSIQNNKVFWELYNLNPNWPASFYDSFEKDGVNPINALVETLIQLITSEINTNSIDGSLIKSEIQEEIESMKHLYSRLYYINNEDVLKENRPGDIYKKENSYYLNIRPECDTTSLTVTDPKIYLLKGDIKTSDSLTCHPPYGILSKDNEEVLLFLDGHDIVVFDKRKLSIEKSSKLTRDYEKICRLAIPFITQIRHNFSSFLGRFGIPSYPKEVIFSLFEQNDESGN